MKKVLRTTLHFAIILVFFALLVFLKIIYFYRLPFYIHFFLDLLAIAFTYLFVQPTLMHTLKRYRKAVIYMLTCIAFALSVLWNTEHALMSNGKFMIDLYFIPIIFSTLFLSVRSGLVLTAIASISHMLVHILSNGFQVAFVIIKEIYLSRSRMRWSLA